MSLPDSTDPSDSVPPPTPAAERARWAWMTAPLLVLVSAGSAVAGAVALAAGYNLLTAASVATGANLCAAGAALLAVVVIGYKFLRFLHTLSARGTETSVPTSWLDDAVHSFAEWRSGTAPSQTRILLRLRTTGAGLRLWRTVIIVIASIGLLGLSGLLVGLASLLLTQVQTRRLEAQNRLIVVQNRVAAGAQDFEQARASAQAEFDAAERVLLDLTSPLALQEQKLLHLPEIAAIQVPILHLAEQSSPSTTAAGANPDDQLVEEYVTFPNAPRVRSLLLAYMKLDRVGYLKKTTVPASPGAAVPTAPVPDLIPLEPVSTALFKALRRLGPISVTRSEASISLSDAEVAGKDSLWHLGATFATLKPIPRANAGLFSPRPERTAGGKQTRFDFRHLAAADFRGVQAPHASASNSIFPKQADFFRAQAQGAYFSKAQAQGADFSGAQLQGATFLQAQVQGADFSHAQVQDTDFGHAQLQGADFGQAQLQGTDFRGADFRPCSATLSLVGDFFTTVPGDDGLTLLPGALFAGSVPGDRQVCRRKLAPDLIRRPFWEPALTAASQDPAFASFVREVLLFAPKTDVPVEHEAALKEFLTPAVFDREWEKVTLTTRLAGARFASEDGKGAAFMDTKTQAAWRQSLTQERDAAAAERDVTKDDKIKARAGEDVLSAEASLKELEESITDSSKIEERQKWSLKALKAELRKLRETAKEAGGK